MEDLVHGGRWGRPHSLDQGSPTQRQRKQGCAKSRESRGAEGCGERRGRGPLRTQAPMGASLSAPLHRCLQRCGPHGATSGFVLFSNKARNQVHVCSLLTLKDKNLNAEQAGPKKTLRSHSCGPPGRALLW